MQQKAASKCLALEIQSEPPKLKNNSQKTPLLATYLCSITPIGREKSIFVQEVCSFLSFIAVSVLANLLLKP